MFRPITINAVLNGWIVTVGCQTVVYQDRNQLVSELDAYLKDPEATEARVLKTAVNQVHTLGGPPPVPAGGGGGAMIAAEPLRRREHGGGDRDA